MKQQNSKSNAPDSEPQDPDASAQHSRETQTENAAGLPGDQQHAQQSSEDPELDPAAVDADGWPLLHRVVMAAANTDPNPPKAKPDDSNSTIDQPAASSSGTGSKVDCATAMATLEDVLERCKYVNLKGPGGFAALHLACLGVVSKSQLK